MRRRRVEGLLGLVLFCLGSACGSAERGQGPPPGSDPYRPAAPFPYDERYLRGSLEDNPGFGWDSCHTRTLGSEIRRVEGDASVGEFSAVFASKDCAVCRPENPSLSQAYFFLDAAPVPAGRLGLYFDIRNLQADAPTGVLRVYGADLSCQAETLLVEVPLAALGAMSVWSTRCVTLDGVNDHQAIGLATAGGTFAVGIDALRLGPACQP